MVEVSLIFVLAGVIAGLPYFVLRTDGANVQLARGIAKRKAHILLTPVTSMRRHV
jgi:hypothetical protein